jgi:hypothetical protein
MVVCVLADIGPMLEPEEPVELGEVLKADDAVDIDVKIGAIEVEDDFSLQVV